MDKELFSEIKDEEFKYPLYANALEKEGLLGYYKESKYIANSITITARGNIGHSIVRKSDFNAIGRLIILNSKKELNNDFFSEYINSNLKFYIESTGVPQLTAPSLKINKVKYPNLDEQNKISNFILAINKKIELLEKKLVLYQNFYSNIVNTYFDNINYKKILKFSDIIKKGKAGGTPKSSNKDYYGGNIPFLSINDMTTQGKYINYTEKMITNEGLNNSSAWILPKNSLLYSIYASIGFVSINKIELTTSQAIYGIILKDNVNQDFIYHYLKNYKRQIHKFIETGTQGNLNSKIVNNIKIKLPSTEEQLFYSTLFNKFDESIEIKEKQINELKKFKKGLLQKMFI